MPTHTPVSIRAVALALLAAGCASGADDAPEAAATTSYCSEAPGRSTYAEAFDQYMVGLTPTPRRFLSAAGTDSALPGPVFEGVQSKGPAYFYPGDEAGRAQVLSRLQTVGPWPTLLVVHRGDEALSDTTVAIRLAGHYVGGDDDGTAAPEKSLIFACDTMPWRFVRSETTTP